MSEATRTLIVAALAFMAGALLTQVIHDPQLACAVCASAMTDGGVR